MATNISKISINTSPSKVWETIKKSELVKLWQYGSDLKTNWKVGSKIEFETEWEGSVFEQWGTVLEYDMKKKLRYCLFAPRPNMEDRPENYFEMNYNLSEENGQTILEIIQEDNRPHAIQVEEKGEEDSVLKLLKQIAETI